MLHFLGIFPFILILYKSWYEDAIYLPILLLMDFQLFSRFYYYKWCSQEQTYMCHLGMYIYISIVYSPRVHLLIRRLFLYSVFLPCSLAPFLSSLLHPPLLSTFFSLSLCFFQNSFLVTLALDLFKSIY